MIHRRALVVVAGSPWLLGVPPTWQEATATNQTRAQRGAVVQVALVLVLAVVLVPEPRLPGLVAGLTTTLPRQQSFGRYAPPPAARPRPPRHRAHPCAPSAVWPVTHLLASVCMVFLRGGGGVWGWRWRCVWVWVCVGYVQEALAGMRVQSIKEKLARGQLDVDVDKLFNEDEFEDDDDEVDAELEAFRMRLQLS